MKRMTINKEGVEEALNDMAHLGSDEHKGPQCWANSPQNATNAVVKQYEAKCENDNMRNDEAKCKQTAGCAWN